MSVDEVRERVSSDMARVREELSTLVRFRSVADERIAPRSECVSAAAWVRDAFRDTGIDDVDLVETVDGSLAVLGRYPAPEGAPTVLLYSHYDVQPAGDETLWKTEPFELTDAGGRWYGRGAADCKGNVVMHLAALRALGAPFPVGLVIVSEGSEETGAGGLERLVESQPGLFTADMIMIADTGNVAVGTPTVTTSLRGIANLVVEVESLRGAVHSGMYGGPAPDALTALVHMLSTLHDQYGDTVVRGLDTFGTWDGVDYPADRFRADAGVLDGVELAGTGSVGDRVWARPALTIMGIDAPPVVGSAAAVVPRAAARLNLRVPPGMDPDAALEALSAHLRDVAPWKVRVSITPEGVGEPFRARTDGPGYAALTSALADAYGRTVEMAGQGGSIPLCTALQNACPDAEIVLMGVEEPLASIHAPNESVDPTEIENVAVAEALFLQRFSAGFRTTEA